MKITTMTIAIIIIPSIFLILILNTVLQVDCANFCVFEITLDERFFIYFLLLNLKLLESPFNNYNK